jgi:N-acetylmuramoyl-L-alanine amidase
MKRDDERWVVIDPGHGGKDPGRLGRIDDHLFRESEVAWSVAIALATLLRERGCRVKITRHQKEFVLPGERADFANAWTDETPIAFVSLHCNGSGNDLAHGFEVWHYPGSIDGENLAQSVLTSLESSLDRRSRGLKPKSDWDRQQASNLTVLRETRMPAILVEMEFLSHHDGQRFLAQGDAQINLATAIADGVMRWLETRKV